MIHQHTMTQLKTVQDPVKLLSSTANITANTTLSSDVVTGTQPVSSGGAVVISSATLNYLKIIPMISSSSNTPTIKITGYSKDSTGTFFVPQLLFYGLIGAISGTGSTINSATLYACTTISKTQGDAKIFNATSLTSAASLLIDTLGNQMIKIEFGNTTTAGTANAFIGAI